MSISRRRFVMSVAALSAASYLPAQASNALTIWGPPVAPTLLLAAAAKQGKAKEIIPFDVKVWRAPDQLRAGLVNGSISMSIVPSYVAANLRNQGQPVLLRNIMTRGLLSLMGKEGNLPAAPADLVGKKLIMPFKGDMPDLVLQILTKRAGIDLSGLVSYTAVPPEAVAQFLQKDFPHALLPEPVASASVLRGKMTGVQVQRGLNLSDWWNESFGKTHGIAQAGLMVSEQAAAQHAEFLAALDDDLLAAVAWVEQEPNAAAKLASEYLPVPAPAVKASFAHSGLVAVPAKQISEDILHFFEQLTALNPKITGGKPADASLFG